MKSPCGPGQCSRTPNVLFLLWWLLYKWVHDHFWNYLLGSLVITKQWYLFMCLQRADKKSEKKWKKKRHLQLPAPSAQTGILANTDQKRASLRFIYLVRVPHQDSGDSPVSRSQWGESNVNRSSEEFLGSLEIYPCERGGWFSAESLIGYLPR